MEVDDVVVGVVGVVLVDVVVVIVVRDTSQFFPVNKLVQTHW